ncbi:MAG TPA: hypothetical protein PK767_01600 [Clostridiales bacterium]|nr:hypothetical protein [Clostridiales bacterium]HOL91178.1 hypothetical protein [Clostridiales bacterium]HPP34922.1 hypothetical protein [Clostridiales bacterium]
MEYICESSENEMIALFLQTEIRSERYRDEILQALSGFGARESVILEPDIGSDGENVLRRKVLARFRGYGEDREIFEGFPEDVRWIWAYVTASELEKVKYIDYDYWVELSGGSRLAKDAAVNIRNGVEIFGVSNDGFLAGAKALLDGAAFPPMILVSDNEETIVLEGHFRLTVYMLEPVCAKDKLKVMIGYTSKEKLMKWSLY